jgi:APA family basic amino acid/polyamine antiporter
VVVSLLMMANYTRGMSAFFEFAILLSTLSVLLPYLLVTLARLRERGGLLPRLSFGQLGIVLYALVFTLWAVVGTGWESIVWGFVLLAAGIPIYSWHRRRALPSGAEAELRD